MADIPQDAVELLASLMQQSHEHTTNIYMDMIVQFKAERDAIADRVQSALERVVHGGTTAQYEEFVEDVMDALYPSHDLLDKYRGFARDWLHGDVHSV